MLLVCKSTHFAASRRHPIAVQSLPHRPPSFNLSVNPNLHLSRYSLKCTAFNLNLKPSKSNSLDFWSPYSLKCTALKLKPPKSDELDIQIFQPNNYEDPPTPWNWNWIFLKKCVIGLVMMAVLLMSDPVCSWAASGGRMGGRAFQSSPSSSSASAFSSPSPSPSFSLSPSPSPSLSPSPSFYSSSPRPFSSSQISDSDLFQFCSIFFYIGAYCTVASLFVVIGSFACLAWIACIAIRILLPNAICVSLRNAICVSLPNAICVSLRKAICVSLPNAICVSLPDAICVSLRKAICVSLPNAICVSLRNAICVSLPNAICVSLRNAICVSLRNAICVSLCIAICCGVCLFVWEIIGKQIALADWEKTSVLKLQVGLLGTARSLQRDLNRIAETARTSTTMGLSRILTETTLALMRHPDYCISAYSCAHFKRSIKEGEKQFERLSIEERAKFNEETLVNVNNILIHRPTRLTADGLSKEYIVVTILVAIQGDHEMPFIKGSEDLKNALQKLEVIPISQIRAVEVLWTPQAENDTLSVKELVENYPYLVPL